MNILDFLLFFFISNNFSINILIFIILEQSKGNYC